MQLNVIDCYYNPQRIDLWNIAGFRKGIEYRYPLLDKRIIELMLKVPSKFLCSTPHPRSVIREISSDILPEEVRWNLEGIDPVFSYQVNEYSRKAAIYYYNELHNWQGDECFQFIDYMKLMKDMDNFKKNPNINPNTFLIHTILLLKSLHEFMKIYKS